MRVSNCNGFIGWVNVYYFKLVQYSGIVESDRSIDMRNYSIKTGQFFVFVMNFWFVRVDIYVVV